MPPLRLLIVDDHPIVRQGLRTVFRVLPNLELAGEAANGREALELVAMAKPDVVLMDLVMPEMDGVAAIAALKERWPRLPVMALTTFAEAELVVGALRAGADGYLLKDVDVHELARAIHTVHSGQPYLHPVATRHLLRTTARPAAPVEQLTEREQAVLRLVGHGLTNKEIGQELGITEKTASVHVSNILGKLALSSRTQAALYAAQTGLVSLAEALPEGSA